MNDYFIQTRKRALSQIKEAGNTDSDSRTSKNKTTKNYFVGNSHNVSTASSAAATTTTTSSTASASRTSEQFHVISPPPPQILSLGYIKSAITRLRSIEQDDGSGDQKAVTRIQVGKNVPFSKFEKFFLKRESFRKKLGIKVEWINGDVFIHEVALGPHGACTAKMIAQLDHHLGNFCIITTDEAIGGQRGSYGAGFCKAPDVCVRPKGLDGAGLNISNQNGKPWPTLVVEVAAGDSLTELHRDAFTWLSVPTVQIFIGIRLSKRRINGTMQMVALRYHQSGVGNPIVPVWAVSFGTGPVHYATRDAIGGYGGATVAGFGAGGAACTLAGMPLYQLHIPSSLLFTGVPIPAGAPAHYDIDLFDVQQAVLETI